MQSDHLKKIQNLLFALVLSGSLNIILATAFGYWYLKESPPKPYFEGKPVTQESGIIELSNAEAILQLKEKSKNELMSLLGDRTLVENGYSRRDLSLGCLVSFHHFDLERALPQGMSKLDTRSLVFGKKTDGKPARLVVYSGLSEEQWKSIEDFAKNEKWPITSRGLFFALKKPENLHDESLTETFFLSQQFLAVETLISRAPVAIAKAEILEMLLQGSWQMLAQFTEEQKKGADFSPQRRQRLLIDYIQIKSKAAAQLILKTDGSFAVKKLDDPHVLLILELIEDKTALSERFALALLASPRGTTVWRSAANKLYDFAKEPRPETFDYQQALAHFLPQHLVKPSQEKQETHLNLAASAPVLPAIPAKPAAVAVSQPASTSASKPAVAFKSPSISPKLQSKVQKDRLYIVQTGDSLWKIARRFNVDVELIRQHNRLNSDALKPGTPLRIPVL